MLDPRFRLTEVRPSIMFDFDLHNPRRCLEADDLEGLNVLYPDCQGGTTEVICHKPALNLGWLRLLLATVAFAVALLVSALANYLARRHLRKLTAVPRRPPDRVWKKPRAPVMPTSPAKPSPAKALAALPPLRGAMPTAKPTTTLAVLPDKSQVGSPAARAKAEAKAAEAEAKAQKKAEAAAVKAAAATAKAEAKAEKAAEKAAAKAAAKGSPSKDIMDMTDDELRIAANPFPIRNL